MKNISKTTIIWLIAGLILVLAAAAIVGLIVMNTVPRPELYYNLDRHLYSLNTQVRTPAEDGLYHLRFGYEEQTLELTVQDPELVSYIDSMDVMGLTVSDEGMVTDAFPADTFATEICSGIFVQRASGDEIHTNTSLAMNGKDALFTRNKKTRIYDLSSGTVVEVLPGALRAMDGITIYGDEEGNATHIYITYRPVKSHVYWRVQRMYNSAKKETSRECDENGVYTLDFYCNGRVVTLQCKDKAVVNEIDAPSGNAHFGLILDRDDYILQTTNAALGMRSLLVCESYDVTELTDSTFRAEKKIDSKGETWSGGIATGCRYYDISSAAKAEDRLGMPVDSMQLGDRVTVWTNAEGNAVLVYITNRLVDVPVFYNVERMYHDEKEMTSRRPDENGFYTVSLLKAGDTETTVYKTDDRTLMTKLDKESSRCVGILADEENVIQGVYPPSCLFGQTIWSSGGVVSSVTGSVLTKIAYGKPSTATHAVIAQDCKIYNVSSVGEFGAATTVQEGDYIYAFRQPTGELIHIYVVRRCLGADTMYYNLDRQYDKETKLPNRQPGADGLYTFTLAHQGQQVTLKTDSKEIADLLDSYSPGAVSLEVQDDRILAVHGPKYACGGSEVANGYTYQGLNEKGQLLATTTDKETTFTLAKDCAIYDIKKGGQQIASIPEGRRLTVYTDREGKALIVFVR